MQRSLVFLTRKDLKFVGFVCSVHRKKKGERELFRRSEEKELNRIYDFEHCVK